MFDKTINNWQDWSDVYMDVSAFTPIIKTICEKHQIEFNEIIPQGFSTNAVFKIGSYIFKIFAPPSSGANTISDFDAEKSALERAIIAGVNVPKLYYDGLIETKYPFYYMVFEYIEALEARKVVSNYNDEQKRIFAGKILDILEKLNKPVTYDAKHLSIKNRYKLFNKWQIFTPSIRKQVDEYIQNLELNDFVYVHGDITEDNILIDQNHGVYLIDFADSTIAPAYYEYPSIIFGLFDFDETLFHLFRSEMNYDDFIDVLYHSILLHEFGAIFSKMILERDGNQTVDNLTNIIQLKESLKRLFKKRLNN